MEGDEDTITMERILEEILENIMELPPYLEAKHGAIVVFTGFSIFGILNLIYANSQILNSKIIILTYLGLIFMTISLIISLNSFWIPCKKCNHNAPSELDDLFYYKDICKYTDREYSDKIFKLHGESRAPTKYEVDLVRQIVRLSSIVSSKYDNFKLSIRCLVVGIGLLLFSLFYQLITIICYQ
jgi:hypothetical protein